jgi:hypothetical protein
MPVLYYQILFYLQLWYYGEAYPFKSSSSLAYQDSGRGGGEPPSSRGSSLIGEVSHPGCMAKSDSFFIRHSLQTTDDNAFYQDSIDLGAYVDALGKSVLRIHNIAVAMTDSGGATPDMEAGGAAGEAKNASTSFQLTTQSQSALILASDKSVIASGLVCAANLDNAQAGPSIVSDQFDNLPQLWTNGYLVAVDSIFLGGSSSTNWVDDVYVTVTMECTVETMSQAAAMALALSQQ